MGDPDDSDEMAAEALCKSCGLCCSGHLFIWVKLKPGELDAAERLGMRVTRSDPTQRGFNQPCPLWEGVCTIYHSPHYPRACKAYQCKQLKSLRGGTRTLPEALAVVAKVNGLIGEVDTLLPATQIENFRERMVSQVEHPDRSIWTDKTYHAFRLKAEELISCIADEFGVIDLIESPQAEIEEL